MIASRTYRKFLTDQAKFQYQIAIFEINFLWNVRNIFYNIHFNKHIPKTLSFQGRIKIFPKIQLSA